MAQVRWRRVAMNALVAAACVLLVAWAWRADLRWFERHTMPCYCARSASAGIGVIVARVIAVALAVLLAVFVRPRLVAWAERTSLASCLRIAVAVIAALAVTELWLRSRPYGDRTPLVRDDLPHAVEDARLGFRFVPMQQVSVEHAGRTIEYSIDARGDRAPSPTAAIDLDRPTLVLAGESIAFGESLPWSESLPGVLAADLAVQVVTIGVPAYGADQAYLRLQDALRELRHPIAVVTTMIPQELRRTGTLTRPHLELHDGHLEPHDAQRPFALTRLWRDEPYHDDTALDLTRAIIAESARETRDHGARPLFVMTNYGPPCLDGDDAWLLGAVFGETPHVWVTLAPDEVVGAPDFHPNAAGARRLATAIERALGLQTRTR